MHKRSDVSLDTLVSKAQHLAKNGGDLKERLETACCLKRFPATYWLRSWLVVKVFGELLKNDSQDFLVYLLFGKASIDVFPKDLKARHPIMPEFAMAKMSETKKCQRHEIQIKKFANEMKNLNAPQIPMAIS